VRLYGVRKTRAGWLGYKDLGTLFHGYGRGFDGYVGEPHGPGVSLTTGCLDGLLYF
jgi:hypothetical protein